MKINTTQSTFIFRYKFLKIIFLNKNTFYIKKYNKYKYKSNLEQLNYLK